MILSLRQRHRRMFAVLGVLLPIAFAAGIVARKPVPAATSLPPGLAAVPRTFEVIEWQRSDLFTKSPMQVSLLRERASAGRLAVSLSAAKDFTKPDLLVYWVAGPPAITDVLPENAALLGAFSAGPLLLPVEAATTDGSLILFSLADQEIVDVSKPVRLKEK